MKQNRVPNKVKEFLLRSAGWESVNDHLVAGKVWWFASSGYSRLVKGVIGVSLQKAWRKYVKEGKQ